MSVETAWVTTRIKQNQIDKYLENGRDFINDEAIWDRINTAGVPSAARVREILAK